MGMYMNPPSGTKEQWLQKVVPAPYAKHLETLK